MSWMKPTVGNPPKPQDPRQDRGKTRNPPTYLKLGGLTGPSKIDKADKMHVEKPEKGTGPYTKG